MERETVPFFTQWMESEGIPVHTGYGVEDVLSLERSDWPRKGGNGAFVQLVGMEGYTGVEIVEVAPGSSLRPERHAYQAYLKLLTGSVCVELRVVGADDEPWPVDMEGESLLGIPLNCEYQVHNTGSSPAVYFCVNDAPLVLDLFRDVDFVFGNPYPFRSRHPESRDELATLRSRDDIARAHLQGWLVQDIRDREVDEHNGKGEAVALTTYELAGATIASHIADWPIGKYHMAHYHQGGAVLNIVASEGYTLMWPLKAGLRPYESGNADQVVRVDWRPGALFSPPTQWFHQHFNTGLINARQLAFRSSRFHPMTVMRSSNPLINGVSAAYVSVREGGNVIDFDLEDPQVRKDYEASRAVVGGSRG